MITDMDIAASGLSIYFYKINDKIKIIGSNNSLVHGQDDGIILSSIYDNPLNIPNM